MRKALRESVNIKVMKGMLRCKFSKNPELKAKPIASRDAKLVEGNNWRNFYRGVCNDKGQNHLGKLLMESRSKVKKRFVKYRAGVSDSGPAERALGMSYSFGFFLKDPRSYLITCAIGISGLDH